MQVSIIIVNYNTKDLTRDCLKSIYEQTKDIEFEVIVSDNGSADGSIEMIKTEFPQVILIENNANLGFGAANNRGLEIAKGEFIFYLNSDTILLNNAVKIFYDYWQNAANKEEIGALGGMLLNNEGQTIHSFEDLPNFKKEFFNLIHTIYGIWKLTLLNVFFKKQIPEFHQDLCKKYTGQVGYVTGADLFLKNNSFAKFDERFFLYYEETDLQFNLAQNNKKRIIIDGPQIVHLQGGSEQKKIENYVQREVSFSNIHLYISRIIYFKKNYGNFWQILILKILTLFLWLNPFIFKKTKKYITQMLSL